MQIGFSVTSSDLKAILKYQAAPVTEGRTWSIELKSKETDESVWVGERLDLALQSSEMGLWDLDLVNDKAFRTLRHDQVFGYDRLLPEWGFEIFLSHVLPEDRDFVKQRFEQAFVNGSFHMECRIMRHDKTVRWISAKGRAFRDENGTLIRLMGSVADITERKTVEEEVIRQKNVLDSFFTLSPDMLCIAGVDGYFKRLNPAFDALGYSREELLSRPFLDFVHPDDQAATLAEVEKLATGVPTISFENRYRCKDGSYRWLAWNCTPEATGTLYAVARDITEQKCDEEARARLAAIVNDSADAIISNTLDGIVTSWNQGSQEMFGYSADEMIGHPIAKLLPPTRKDEEAHNTEHLANGERIDHYETVRTRKDGREIEVSVTVSALRDASGKLIGTSKIARDITEFKRVQRELVRAKEAAEAANRELDSFSYSVAHDLRSPLRAIEGFAKMLEEDYLEKLDAEGRRYIQVIRDGSQRMNQLIDDLLTFSRIGRSSLRRTLVDMTALARDAMKGVLINAQGVAPNVKIGDLPSTIADATILRQVWLNLIGNAVKFSAKTENALIEVWGELTDQGPMYHVRDNGAGFDMKWYDKLFGVFQRLHSADAFPGTGVGLAIVQRIVVRHGGRVWAEGTPGAGACFHFTVPSGEPE